MGLTRLAVDRPIVVLMAFAAILLLGIYGYRHMPAELDPQIDIAVVNVMTIYPGASPRQVEERVTRTIEDAVASINGVDGVDSTSLEHVSNVTVRFREGTDPNAAAAEVKARAESSRGDLPPEAAAPVVSKVDLNAQPVMVVGVAFGPDVKFADPKERLRALRSAVEDQVRPKLSQAVGVASVKIVGGAQREVQVQADPDRLQQFDLSVTDLVGPLLREGQSAASGRVSGAGGEGIVRVRGDFTSVDDIANVPIWTGSAPGMMGGGARGEAGRPASPVLIRDVATVTNTVRPPNPIVRVGATDGVVVMVTRLADANTVEVAEHVRARIQELRHRSPELQISVLQDHSEGVRLAMEDINASLVLGSLLAVLVVFLFLHNIKDTLIVAVAIPSSIIATFAVMWLVGFTLNQMTMLALSLSVGILVDDSILVLDSIQRHRRQGQSPRVASLEGRQEIGLADATNTLVDVVVFVPVALMGGVIGMYFKQFGLTVATATLFSMYVSFTLTPMLTAHWFRKGEGLSEPTSGLAGAFNRAYGRLEQIYRGFLAWALRHRPLVLVAGFGSLGIALALAATKLGMDLLPAIDHGEIQIVVEMDPRLRLADTDQAVRKIEEILRNPAVKNDIDADRTFVSVGEITGSADRLPERGPSFAELKIKLRDKEGVEDWIRRPLGGQRLRTRSDQQIAEQIRDLVQQERQAGQLPDVARVSVTPVASLERQRAPLAISLMGEEGKEAQLGLAAEAVRESWRDLDRPDGRPMLVNVDSTYRPGLPELQVNVRRDRATELQVSPAEIVNVTRTALEGNTDARFRDGDHSYPIRVQVEPTRIRDREELAGLVVAVRDDAPIYLADVADVESAAGATRILRRDKRPLVRVTAGLGRGVDLGTAKSRATEDLEALRAAAATLLKGKTGGGPLPGDDRARRLQALASLKAEDFQWTGDTEGLADSMRDVTWALVFAVALSYMLMAALFNSFLHPLTIIFSVPMALVGAVLALLVTGTSLSMAAMIGVIMLVGLVSKNAILLVDYTNTLRARDGHPRDEAILMAGPVRLRPILMTTIAMILGMMPVAMRIGRASEIRAPMAIVVIGGLLVSTLLTLIVIPIVYTYFDDLTRAIQGAWTRRFGAESEKGGDRRRPAESPGPVPSPEPAAPATGTHTSA